MNAESPSTLNELELDALTELVNLGVSKAALSLREMTGEQVLLSVPRVDLIPRARAIETLGKNEPNRLVAVHQVFDGDIHGRALLIFQGNTQSRACPRRHQWKPAARGHPRTRARSARRDRQHHPERMSRHHRQSAAADLDDLPARNPARRQPRAVQPASAS